MERCWVGDGSDQGQHNPAKERIYKTLQYAASFHCLVLERHDCEELKPMQKDKGAFVDKKLEAQKHRTQWCAIVSKDRCMERGRSCKKMKNAREM